MKLLRSLSALALAVAASVGALSSRASAQGVTTASMTGTVVATNGVAVAGATVQATHVPSGTLYRATTRSDGRFTIPGMRVGGPYQVTVRALGFQPKTREDLSLSLGVSTDLQFTLEQAATQLQAVAVTATAGPFSSTRTGASTTITNQQVQSLPTITRTIGDFTRLTPQAVGNSFAGQDNRFNNLTLDGSFFNNSFGLQGQPGQRTGVAPVPLDAIEQVQVNIAPFDVRQGNFVGAGINAVTKSGTNEFSGSIYGVQRNEGYVGTKAGDLAFNPGTFNFGQFGARLGGPILKNKLFFFANYENDGLEQPGTTFLANTGSQTVAGNTTRVLKSDLDRVSALMKSGLNYETGGYTGWSLKVPSSRLITRFDWNANANNKVSLRYIQLDSKSDQPISNSTSLGFGNRRDNANSMSFANSGYAIKENIRSVVGEINSQLGTNKSNNFILGFSSNDESREYKGDIFPTVDILKDGVTYMSLGFEPFTPANQLRYKTLQAQDNFTWYTAHHDFTFGAAVQKYRSENVFYPGSQSVYVYNSLDDFITDVNGYVANPNRTTSPVTLRRFEVRYMNIPGLKEPMQPLDVIYAGAYAQDEWRATSRLKLTFGLRLDVPKFKETGYTNTQANALTFRDENGASVKYQTQKLPDASILWSPRFGFNWDVRGDRSTQVRGGTGIFTGSPPYVWISNQIGQNGILTGFEQLNNVTSRPFNPNPTTYMPKSVTGAPASSYELNFTNADYKFPQLWRTNIAIDQKLPWGFTGTLEYLYGKDVNGAYYINANLPAAQSAFVGADARPRWTNARLNSNITAAYVLKNQDVGYSYSIGGSLERAFTNGFFVKGGYNYGVTRNTIDPGSIAAGSYTGNAMSGNPNNPGVGYAATSPGHRSFLAASYKKEYFKMGATTVSFFAERFTLGNTSYTFSGDLNGDGGTSNDLIYIPKSVSEMNFEQFTASGVTFTAAQQAAAWDAFIKQDDYLKSRRGQYAERGAVFLPQAMRVDMSLTQDLFRDLGGKRNTLQLRMDILNVGNFLNKDWGLGQRLVTNTPLIARGADAQGRALYRLRNIGTNLISKTYEQTAGIADVYRFQLGLRYNFN
ncbi:MAG: carboxypeptidase regulatory-like domain-containing protein [Gemmatimonadaceae bacterium]